MRYFTGFSLTMEIIAYSLIYIFALFVYNRSGLRLENTKIVGATTAPYDRVAYTDKAFDVAQLDHTAGYSMLKCAALIY